MSNVRKFKPSNHSQGDAFICDWCGTCQRGQHEPCDIVARTMWIKVEAPDYPEEWQYNCNDEPVCTAHVENGQSVPPSRCKNTADMFDGATRDRVSSELAVINGHLKGIA